MRIVMTVVAALLVAAPLPATMKRYPQAEVIVPGHGAEGGKELLTHTLELLKRR